MFGYIRPMQGELKVRELERFKACYCGLCHALGKRYGLAARFVLSYELVFLAMLLWQPNEQLGIKHKRCIASPIKKRRCCSRSDTLNMCAGYSVILAWWKLKDTIADEPFIRAIPHRVLSLILSRAYRKAARDYPGFNGRVKEELAALTEYEHQDAKSFDMAADKFASILKAAAPMGLPEKTRRPMLELLYHLGRWIYIIDACDDYQSDVKAGRFNPVAARCSPVDGKLPEQSTEELETTLTHSNNILCSAFELLPENIWTDTVRNMIYLGMPDVCSRVLTGKWAPGRHNEVR